MANDHSVSPVAAFDITSDGKTNPVTDSWPKAGPETGFAYRWIHFDVNDPGLAAWANAHLPGVAAVALQQTETRPRCDSQDGGVILNLRGINLNPDADTDDMVSIRMWVTANLIVSARIRRVFAAETLYRGMQDGTGPATPAGWLCRLTHLLTDRIEDASLELEDATGLLEEALADDIQDSAEKLMPLRRTTIKIRRYVGPQREALSRLAILEDPLATDAERVELREVTNRTMRSVEELDALMQRLQALQDFVNAQRSEAMTRNGFILSIVAAIFLPLGFFTGLFGVNVAGMPGTDWPYAFGALTVVMVVIGVALYFFFRHLRWF